MNKIYLENDEATNKLGLLISEQLKKIDKSLIEIHLEGDLGAGKTFLTRSILSNYLKLIGVMRQLKFLKK